MTKTKTDIQEFITGTLKQVANHFGNAAADVAPEANLLKNGFIDSLGFVSLMSAIEQTYEIELDFEGSDPERFTTIQGLVDCTALALDKKEQSTHMVLQAIKKLIPAPLMEALRRHKRTRQLQRLKALPAITEKQFLDILTEILGVSNGSLVMVHTSIGDLNLAFSPMRIVPLLKQAVGDDGTLLFLCTSKAESEMDFLDGTQTFNRKRTPTGAGLVSELARRTSGAIRSLHPTKSVCAIGSLAEELTSGHEDSPYPFDKTSPYGKFVERNGLVIGLGVTAYNLSIAHCVEDFMKDEFPISKYQDEYEAECIDYDGSSKKVRSLASNPAIWAGKTCMTFFNTYIDKSILRHHLISGQNFFSCHAAPLIERMTFLAREGKTMYPTEANKDGQS